MHLRNTAALCAALALGGFASAASATTFLYTYSSNDGLEGASGTLDATSNGDGTYTVTSGTIDAFGPITTGSGSIIANPSAPAASVSPQGYFLYDDQLLPGQNPLITNPGLLFDVAGNEVNIYSNGPGPGTYEFQTNVGGSFTEDFGNFTLSEVGVPEPATWGLMLLGFGLMGVAMRSSRKAALA